MKIAKTWVGAYTGGFSLMAERGPQDSYVRLSKTTIRVFLVVWCLTAIVGSAFLLAGCSGDETGTATTSSGPTAAVPVATPALTNLVNTTAAAPDPSVDLAAVADMGRYNCDQLGRWATGEEHPAGFGQIPWAEFHVQRIGYIKEERRTATELSCSTQGKIAGQYRLVLLALVLGVKGHGNTTFALTAYDQDVLTAYIRDNDELFHRYECFVDAVVEAGTISERIDCRDNQLNRHLTHSGSSPIEERTNLFYSANRKTQLTTEETVCAAGQRKHLHWNEIEDTLMEIIRDMGGVVEEFSIAPNDPVWDDPTLPGRACRTGASIDWLNITDAEFIRRGAAVGGLNPDWSEQHFVMGLRIITRPPHSLKTFVLDYCACKTASLEEAEMPNKPANLAATPVSFSSPPTTPNPTATPAPAPTMTPVPVPTATPTAEQVCANSQLRHPGWTALKASIQRSLQEYEMAWDYPEDPTLPGRACRIGETVNWLGTTDVAEIQARVAELADPEPTTDEKGMMGVLWTLAQTRSSFVADYCACEIAYLDEVGSQGGKTPVNE